MQSSAKPSSASVHDGHRAGRVMQEGEADRAKRHLTQAAPAARADHKQLTL
jgi:hypothetical protein